MIMIPIEGHDNLFRDEKSGAIINCDEFGYSQYISIKNKRKSEKEELDILKNEINEIKSLLNELINSNINKK